MTKLKTNKYGQIDIRKGLNGKKHIPSKKYKPIQINNVCGNLGIDYAPALTGFKRSGKSWNPRIDGVVVCADSYPRLEAEVDRRKAKRERKMQFAKNYSSKEEALPDAAEAMMQLNIYAQYSRCSDVEREEILALKKNFVRYLYKRGYCTDVALHRPRNLMTVMNTSWEGSDRLAFNFAINGENYCWHQPKRSIGEHIEVTKPLTSMPEIPVRLVEKKTKKFPKKKARDLIKWILGEEIKNKNKA